VRLLTFQHVTVYRYAEPVKLSEHRMMFRPRESHDLRLVRTQLIILSQPAGAATLATRRVRQFETVATCAGKTNRLCFESIATLEYTKVALPDYYLEAGAATFPLSYSPEDRPDLVRALERTWMSPSPRNWIRAHNPQHEAWHENPRGL
jgi:hypothetical protein